MYLNLDSPHEGLGKEKRSEVSQGNASVSYIV